MGKYQIRKPYHTTHAAVCPICKGCGTMLDGSTCYYCQGSGEAD